MNPNDKLPIFLLSIVVTAVTLIIGTVAIYNYNVTRVYVENGYEQTVIPGIDGKVWVLAK